MPIYEYRCSRCEHEFEVWQKMSDPPVKVCPKCHAHKVEKLVSLSSFQLKGSGWYATDYGKAGSRGKSPASTSESSSPAKDGSSEKSGEKSTEKSTEKSSEPGKSDKGGGEKAGETGGGKAASGSGTPRLAAAAA